MKNRLFKFFPILLVAVLLISVLAGCSQSTILTAAVTSTVTVTDVTGHTLKVASPVNNLVTLFGPGYEKLVILGAEDKIVACGDL